MNSRDLYGDGHGFRDTWTRTQKEKTMKNLRMEEMLRRGSAIDLSECKKDPTDRFYIIEDPFALNCLNNDIAKDFCDKKTEQWIWSIGRMKEDRVFGKDETTKTLKKGTILASTTSAFYENPFFDCLWLR